ncbi:TPA: hypothetical protein IX867_001156 [Enterococcus faecium]|nr:hypothetical protein [Enterococcus faecium]HAP9334970.1 hypothetical protein [Enterococcus faecium]HAQ4758705.1 hypothetical protein [Enterococcus faecium]HAQ4770489.1 hypothetical protein [Enterococcus faecium]HAQ5104491.1 hypothetical protein [Enterococcus faecium]
MSDIIIGILLVISFFFMVWYCVKGYNLMVGFAIMATVWMGLGASRKHVFTKPGDGRARSN